MIRIRFICLSLFAYSLFLIGPVSGQVVLNEVFPNGAADQIELKNTGATTIDVSTWWLCSNFAYGQLSSLTASGSLNMAPGDIVTLTGFGIDDAMADVGLYTVAGFGNAANMASYMQYGTTGNIGRTTVAVAAGLWTTGTGVNAPPAGESLQYDGAGNAATDWYAAAPTIDAENQGPCLVDGGTLAGGPYEFCIDGVSDNVSGLNLTNAVGANQQIVITDTNGVILGLPPSAEAVDFEGAGPGVCLIWNLSFEDGLTGAAVGNNAATDLVGCYDLSNPITVTRISVAGGTLVGGPFDFCVGDGVADNVSGVTLSGASGPNQQIVVTDQSGVILGLPPSPEAVDFDGAGPGICLIWNVAFADGLIGAAVGSNATDLVGCFDLSNPITVTRRQPDGGTLAGGPYNFCVDGVPDNVSGLSLSNAIGSNLQIVITDTNGVILGLPPSAEAVDFDAAGPGVCLIWHLAYEDGLTGATVGANAADLVGCYDLSNPITVNRLGPVDGGVLAGGPFTFCVGDGVADNVSGVTLSGESGPNQQIVVTDANGVILGLPPTPEAVDFEGAGPGVCLIWNLAFADGLTGAVVGNNASTDLVGCFDLSPPITVTRTAVDGGVLTGGPYSFCVDGVADNVTDLTLTNATGANQQIVITDTNGVILGLPPSADVVDFDAAGPGVCLIWNLSFADGLTGAAVGANAATDLVGCYDLSNPITVTRSAAVDGGTLAGGPFTFCVGDGVADNVSGVTLSGETGPNQQIVVTDTNGVILGLPPTPEAVDFDGAGPGVCLIWNLAFADGLTGAAEGNNATTDLVGCFDLSNPIMVTRDEVDGGMLIGGPYSFCVDGTPDNVSGLTLTNAVGANQQIVITDTNGLILGLPPSAEVVDFDAAGPGVCLIWNLSFADGLTGAAVGNNAADLVGCFDLSNPITVIRSVVDGGTLAGGPYSFCVDGVADNVSGLTLTNTVGANQQIVITDTNGVILGLPPNAEAVDFDAAGPGVCLIWNLAFGDGLTGAAVGNNATTDLVGCFDLSNPITVTRTVVDGGTLDGGPYDFCVDGIADNVSGLTLTNAIGANQQIVITDTNGVILGLPPSAEAVDFDGAGPGVCLIWNLAFADGLSGAAVGSNAADLVGCFDLSNPITVTRTEVDGGMLIGGPYEFCVDGVADNAIGVTLTNATGANQQIVITDTNGLILGLPPSADAVDFDAAGPGVCLIWNLSFAAGLTGAEVGNNATTDLGGCYDLSNPITVTRTEVDGGTLAGGPFDFCVDGVADNVSGVTLTNASGANQQIVITDTNGMILGLPPSPEAVNFDDAGPGVCLIWNLSFADGLTGAAVGNNATTDLVGCYDLSNPITVTRTEPDGGTLSGGPFSFCVGDGVADNVSGVSLAGATGPNQQIVVTDTNGMILGLPPSPEAVDFDGAGPGVCLIWNLSFADGLTGAALGNNATTDLAGCYDLSNPIMVTRIQPDGGTLTGGPYNFCVDGVADNVSGLSLAGATGPNQQIVVTDTAGMILGLPPNAEAVDFDGAGPGVCLIWNLSFADGLTGAAVGNNANTDLVGCYDLSNPITVTRTQPDGGTLTGGPYSFCVDGTADNVSGLALSGATGPNSQYVITDTAGVILGLPPTPEVVDFDAAGVGVCLIWHLAFADGLTGAAVGNNAMTDLVGCYDLSNPITVNRTQPDAGSVETANGQDSVVLCMDGNPDPVTVLSVGRSETLSPMTYVVTDDSGTVLMFSTNNVVDLNGASLGTCRIYALAYAGELMKQVGISISNVTSSGCVDLSDNFITVRRINCDGATPGVVSGVIWNDQGNDGNPANDNLAVTGLENIPVTISLVMPGAAPVVAAVVTTGVGGAYASPQLSPGTYLIAVDPADLPASMVMNSTPLSFQITLGATSGSNDINFGFLAEPSVAILESFTVTAVSGGVALDWTIGFELDHLGYRVHRSATPDGARTQVGDRLTLADGRRSYSAVDAAGDSGSFYWLESVSANLDTEFFGPFRAPTTSSTIVDDLQLVEVHQVPFSVVAQANRMLVTGLPERASLTIPENAEQATLDGEAGAGEYILNLQAGDEVRGE